MNRLANYLPILEWGRQYYRATLSNDLVAAVIVTIMLIPQSLAYALLAGLPPEVGLYASILPLVAYAVFGTSRALAVGPVAVVSLMTAAAIGELATQARRSYARGGGGARLPLRRHAARHGRVPPRLHRQLPVSHPVISGFITASGMLIAASQLKHILGIKAEGETLPQLVPPSSPTSAPRTGRPSSSAWRRRPSCSGSARA